MDNMAYLQQIAGVDNSLNNPSKKGGLKLPSFINIWTMLGAGLLIIVIVIVMVLTAAMNKVDSKDQDLMIESYWMSTYLMEETFDEYSEDLKSPDIRNMTASLKSVLSEIILNDTNILLEEYGIEVDDGDDEEGIPADESAKNTELNSVLEDARLNGILDRVYVREITMQIAQLRAKQSEIAARTKNDKAREFAEKAESNLDNIYEQFHNYKNLAI
jgi:hypothetical protein